MGSKTPGVFIQVWEWVGRGMGGLGARMLGFFASSRSSLI